MEKVGIQLTAEGAAEFTRQVNSAKESITNFATSTTSSASNLRTYDTAATGVTQALTALKSRQVETVQSSNQFKSASSELASTLTHFNSAQNETAQGAGKLKTAHTEEVQELNKLKTAQTEQVQELNKVKTAETEQVQEIGKIKTAQTEQIQSATKLKTVESEEVQELSRLKAAQINNVEASTQLKVAQTQAATALTHLRGEQMENVAAATQVKNAQVEETHAAVQLKTAQTEAAQSLANLRKEQTADASTITTLKAKNLELDASLKQTKISTLEQSKAHTTAAKSGDNFGSVTSLLNAKNSALAIGTGLAVKSTIELAAGFDDAMATVQVATGVTDRQSESYKKLEAAARDVGGSTKFSATEAAQGLAALSQAGLDADQAITALPAVAQAAAVNNVSLAESATSVTVAMNAFGLSASDATKIIDIQTTAAAAGILDFNDFKQAIAAVGSVAKLSNQSLTETTSVLLALTNNGQSASDAGTSVKSALLALTKPTDAARAAMDELGLKVYDATGKMIPFSDIVAQVEKGTKGMTDEQKNQLLATIAGSDGIRAFSGAMNAHVDVMRNGEKVTLTGSAALKEWDKQLDNSAGSTKKAADVMGETFNAKLEKMTGNLQDAAIGIGQKLLPQLGGLVDGVSKIIDKIQGFEESTHILTTMTSIGFKPLELAINAVLFVFDKVGEAVKFAQPYIDLLGVTIQTKVIPALNNLKDIIATPFEMLDVALKKVDFGIASSNTEALKKKIEELKGKTDDTSKATDTFGINLNRIQTATAKDALGDLGKAVGNLGTNIGGTSKAVKDLMDGIVNVSAKPIADGIIALLKYGDASGSTGGKLKIANDEIDRLTKLMNDSSKEMGDASGKMGTLDKMANDMSPDVSNLWKEWKNYKDRVADGGVASDSWSTAADKVKDRLIQLNPKMADVTSAYEIQSEKLANATTAYQDNTISTALNEGKQADLAKQLKGETSTAFGNVAKAALGTIPDFESMHKKIQETPGVTSTAMSDAKNSITGQNWLQPATSIGQSIGQGITAGINSQVSAAATAAANIVTQALGAARSAGRISSPSKEMIEKVGQPLAEGVAVGITNGGPGINNAFSKVMDQFNQGGSAELQNAMNQFDQITHQGVQKIGTTIHLLPPQAVDAMANFNTGGAAELQKAMDAFDAMSKKGANQVNANVQTIPANVVNAMDTFNTGGKAELQAAMDAFDKISGKGTAKVNDNIKSIPATAGDAMDNFNTGGSSELQKAMDNFDKISKLGVQKFGTTIHLMPTATGDAVTGIKDKLLAGAKDVQGDATKSATDFLSSYADGVKASVDIIPSTVSGVMGSILGVISDGAAKWNKDIGTVPVETRKSMSVFKLAVSEAVNSYNASVSSLGPTTQSKMDDIKVVLDKTDFKPQGTNLGKSLMQGIMDGMDSRLDDLIKKSQDAVNKAIDAAKKAGDIHSPSKVMAVQVGLPLMQGLSQGITDNAKLPQAAMTRQVINPITQPVQYPMSAGQMMMNNYNQQSYQNNYNLNLSGMGMSSGNVMSDFAIMQLMGA